MEAPPDRCIAEVRPIRQAAGWKELNTWEPMSRRRRLFLF